MGSAFQVFRLLRYAGTGGCAHHLLLRAGQPSYPNADAGAEDAAGAFVESQLDHLAGWWARWWLGRHCPGPHSCELVGQTDDSGLVFDPGVPDLLEARGMRMLKVWTAALEPYSLVLGAARDEAAFWAAVEEDGDLEPAGPATCFDVYFLTDADGSGDLRDAPPG